MDELVWVVFNSGTSMINAVGWLVVSSLSSSTGQGSCSTTLELPPCPVGASFRPRTCCGELSRRGKENSTKTRPKKEKERREEDLGHSFSLLVCIPQAKRLSEAARRILACDTSRNLHASRELEEAVVGQIEGWSWNKPSAD